VEFRVTKRASFTARWEKIQFTAPNLAENAHAIIRRG